MSGGLIIAVDGFSSCGKSTLARDLANQLDYIYIDSGAMYRAVTLFFIQNSISLEKEDAVNKALEEIEIDLKPDGRIFLNGHDVTARIRQADVSDLVSEVAAVSAVRRQMVALQKAFGLKGGIVMDGRDIGTVVFPEADLKIFMTADPDIRAQRRFEELKARGNTPTMDEVHDNLRHRDHIDSTREDSPLTMAENAVLIDNTEMNRQQQLAHVLALVKDIQNNRR